MFICFCLTKKDRLISSIVSSSLASLHSCGGCHNFICIQNFYRQGLEPSFGALVCVVPWCWLCCSRSNPPKEHWVYLATVLTCWIITFLTKRVTLRWPWFIVFSCSEHNIKYYKLVNLSVISLKLLQIMCLILELISSKPVNCVSYKGYMDYMWLR